MGVALGITCLMIVAASLLGGFLPLASALTHTRLQGYLSFSAGAMLGAVFFHMLPDAVENSDPHVLQWTIAGLLTLFFLERFFAFHHHEAGEGHAGDCEHGDHSHDPETETSSGLHWGIASFGLAVHTLVGGFALASAFDVDGGNLWGATAFGVFIATLVHKPADSLTIVSLMLRAGMPRRLAHAVNLGFAFLLPVGVGAYFVGRSFVVGATASHFTAAVLSFSAGTFLCIALSDLLPELQFHKHDRLTLSVALLLGVGLMAFSGFWH